MKTNLSSPRFLFIASAILIAAVSRLMPHFPNFTPIAAMALFGGATLSNKKLAVVVPLIAMLLSDLVIGFHSTIGYVYAGFIVTSFIGIYLQNNVKPGSIVIGSLLSSTLFFIITNFGYWAQIGFAGGMPGLMKSYIDAVPFFGPTLVGDLFYNAILFGAFYIAQLRFPALVKVK